MAHDSLGAKNQPQYSTTGVPADAADLSEIANYAALTGNYMADTSSVRTGLTGSARWVGLLFYETDTGLLYMYTSTGWVGWSLVTSTRSNRFVRSSANAVDTFGADGTFGAFAAGAIVNAPAGEYLIGCNLGMYASAIATGNLRITANTTNLTTDAEMGLTTVAQNLTYATPFTHTGGTLTLTLLYKYGGVVGTDTASVKRDGTNVWYIYVGP